MNGESPQNMANSKAVEDIKDTVRQSLDELDELVTASAGVFSNFKHEHEDHLSKLGRLRAKLSGILKVPIQREQLGLKMQIINQANVKVIDQRTCLSALRRKLGECDAAIAAYKQQLAEWERADFGKIDPLQVLRPPCLQVEKLRLQMHGEEWSFRDMVKVDGVQ